MDAVAGDLEMADGVAVIAQAFLVAIANAGAVSLTPCKISQGSVRAKVIAVPVGDAEWRVVVISTSLRLLEKVHEKLGQLMKHGLRYTFATVNSRPPFSWQNPRRRARLTIQL